MSTTPGGAPDRVPDLLVEQLHLGELAPDVAHRVRERLAEEPGGLARLDALAADRSVLPPRRAARPAPPATRWLRLGVPALVAALAAVLLVTRAPDDAALDLLGVRSKGGAGSRPALIVYRQRAQGGFEVLADHAVAHPGDVLQLAYVAVGRQVGAIISIDGAGHTTTHLPATRLEQGGEVRLPSAFSLDAAPAFERFVLMTTAPDTGLLELQTLTVDKR